MTIFNERWKNKEFWLSPENLGAIARAL